MVGQILVLLKTRDRVEEIVPYIEKIAQPGVRVVFLIPYPVDLWLWWRDHWVTTESPREAILAGRKITESYSWELQRQLAEQRVLPARDAFRKMKVEIAVDVYIGSLSSAVQNYTANGDVYLIVTWKGTSFSLMGFLRGMIPLFGLVKRHAFSLVLLQLNRKLETARGLQIFIQRMSWGLWKSGLKDDRA